MTAPMVLAAYTPPTSRPGSCPLAAAAARASGKLAPQRTAAGSTAHSARAISSWKLNHTLDEIEGLIGQYGSDSASIQAAQAMAPTSSTWHQPSARRGCARVRDSIDPAPLPIPSPTRKTARMMEKVYTDPPNSRPSWRVQITSAASALKPDSAITTYTAAEPGRAATADWPSVGAAPRIGRRSADASPNATSATRAFTPAATQVAVVTSKTRRRKNPATSDPSTAPPVFPA